jgi:hypothetical protein
MTLEEWLDDWLATRPPSVQALAREFPPGCCLQFADGERRYVCGYTEDDILIVSRISFVDNWEGAMMTKEYLDAALLRDGEVKQ